MLVHTLKTLLMKLTTPKHKTSSKKSTIITLDVKSEHTDINKHSLNQLKDSKYIYKPIPDETDKYLQTD